MTNGMGETPHCCVEKHSATTRQLRIGPCRKKPAGL